MHHLWVARDKILCKILYKIRHLLPSRFMIAGLEPEQAVGADVNLFGVPVEIMLAVLIGANAIENMIEILAEEERQDLDETLKKKKFRNSN